MVSVTVIRGREGASLRACPVRRSRRSTSARWRLNSTNGDSMGHSFVGNAQKEKADSASGQDIKGVAGPCGRFALGQVLATQPGFGTVCDASEPFATKPARQPGAGPGRRARPAGWLWLVSAPAAVQRVGSNPHQRRPTGDGVLEVAAHAHGELLEGQPLGAARRCERCEALEVGTRSSRVVGERWHRHQPTDLEPCLFVNGLGEVEGRLGVRRRSCSPRPTH